MSDMLKIILIGIGLWFFAFIYAMFVMGGIGVNFKEPNFQFGPEHILYWQFEKIMIPSMLLFCGIISYYFLTINSTSVDIFNNINVKWLSVSLTWGIIIMICQFILDTIVLVILMNKGFVYFQSMVTLSYLSIPIEFCIIGYYKLSKLKDS